MANAAAFSGSYTANLGPSIEGYLTLSMHLESLLEQISPRLDAPITAQLLLNALNVNLISYLRREQGVSLDAIKRAVRPLTAGLIVPSRQRQS